MNKTFTALIAVAMALSALAVDTSIAYQGVLKNAAGTAAITGAKNITFALYTTATGGTAIWGRTVAVNLDDSGLFNVDLTDSNGSALAGASNANLVNALKVARSGTLYVGLTVEDSSGEIQPRQKILMTPYASWAADATNASGDFSVAGKATVKNAEVTNELIVDGKTTLKGDVAFSQDYRPIAVGSKLVVVPEWEEIPDGGRLALRLDPGLTFGTGSHATTRLCLQALENWAAPGKRVLDLGCGSGILGIGALILGCESCLGVDVDPKSPDVASDNAALNGLHEDRIRFLAGDLLADASLRRRLGTGYDIVLANIVADVIIPLSPHVPAFLAPGGVYISSGIIDGRQEEVRRAIEDSGFRILSHSSEDGWHCFAAAL